MKKLKIFESAGHEQQYKGDIKIIYYEGSDLYDDETLKDSTYSDAKKLALEKLQAQKDYRNTNENLWATFSFKDGDKFEEDFDLRVVLGKDKINEDSNIEEITKEEWDKTHKDYKSVKDGQKYILKFVEGVGTSLIPVNIVG